MNWSVLLSLAVVVSVLFAMTFLKPRAARPGAQTRLIAIARVALLVSVVILFYLTLSQRAGH